MKARHLIVFALGSAALAVGCAKPYLGGPSRDKSIVTITIGCTNGELSAYRIDRFVAEISDRTKKFTWNLAAVGTDVIEARIVPKGTNPWPFAANPDPVKPGKSTKSKALKASLPAGTYKYQIDVVCRVGTNGQNVVPIDPDMIIPKGTGLSETQ